MKKNILYTAMALSVAAVGGYNVYLSQTVENLSELTLANVEALAQNDDDKKKQTCDTGSKPTGLPPKCPLCKEKAGPEGIDYFRIEGDYTSYKSGFEGTYYYCACNGHDFEECTAEIKSCS